MLEDQRAWNTSSSPALPLPSWPQRQHREKNVEVQYPLVCSVARPVSLKERRNNKMAQESCDNEWFAHIEKRTWDMDKVGEWADVSSEAKAKQTQVRVARIFEMCVEKGSGLREPARNT